MPKKIQSKRVRSVVKWISWALVFQFILINISASLHAWKQTHFYTDPALRVARTSSRNIFVKTWKLFSGLKYPRSVISKFPDFPFDTVDLKTGGGLKIDCWYSKADSLAKGTVVLFHAMSGNKSNLLQEASEFRYWGYNVLLVDLRGHGSSDGNSTSIGVWESEEVKLAYDYIRQKGEKNIFLYGVSMGASVIAKAFKDYDIQPSGVILEMPIFSLQAFLEAHSKFMGFPEEPFGFFVTAWIGIEQGYNGFRHKPSEYIRKINCPVLLQWGDRDRYISKSQIQRIYDHIPGSKKKFVIYENAGHQQLLGLDPLKWRFEVKAMLDDPQSVRPS